MEKLTKQAALEFQSLIELIEDVAENLRKKDYILKETTNIYRHLEYGYYIHSRDKRFNVFLGLWTEFWVDFGEPLVLSFDTKDLDWERESSDYKKKLSTFKNIAENKSGGIKGYTLYKEFPVLIISKDDIGVNNFPENLSKEIDAICKILGFNLPTLR